MCIYSSNNLESFAFDMSSDDRESEAVYFKITHPQAVHGKLDFQDYKEITDKALRTGKPFKDDMVK